MDGGKIAEIILALFGVIGTVWGGYITYAKNRDNNRAKEKEHILFLEKQKQEAEIKDKAADTLERDKLVTTLQTLVDRLSDANANNTKLLENQSVFLSNQGRLLDSLSGLEQRERERLDVRKSDLENRDTRMADIVNRLGDYTRGVSELSGNIVDKLGSITESNKLFYTGELDKRVLELENKSKMQYDEVVKLLNNLENKLISLESKVEEVKSEIKIAREELTKITPLPTVVGTLLNEIKNEVRSTKTP